MSGNQESIVERAFEKANAMNLDLGVKRMMVPADAFKFNLLEPTKSVMRAFHKAKIDGVPWPEEVPIPILTYHKDDNQFGIMDGMMRIRAAGMVGMESFPAFVASGDTYQALEPILSQGYHGDDFVELLSLVNPAVKANQESVNRNRLAGL